jgi:hypothetical protein
MTSLAPTVLTNADYVIKAESLPGLNGMVVWLRFPNDYGLSIVRHDGSYGNQHGEGLFEAGLIKFRDESTNWDFVETNQFGFDGSGVQGWLSVADIDRLVIIVRNLAKNAITAIED